jgi:hypothetical protein
VALPEEEEIKDAQPKQPDRKVKVMRGGEASMLAS